MHSTTYRLACTAGLLFLPLGLNADPRMPPRPDTTLPHPVVSVRAVYPGMTAQEGQSAIGAALEQQLLGAEGIQRVLSRASKDGTYSMMIYLKPGVDSRNACTRVKQHVQLTLPALPTAVRKRGVAVYEHIPCPLLLISVFSPDGRWHTSAIGRYAQDKLRGQLAQLPGVADVTRLGPGRAMFLVRIDPDRLASYDIKIGEVRQALQQQNNRSANPKGSKASGSAGASPSPLLFVGERHDAKRLQDAVIKTAPGGQAIRVRDVATIEVGVRDRDAYADLDGHPAVGLIIYANGHAQPRAVRAAVLRKLSALQRALPPSLRIGIGVDLVASAEDADDAHAPSYLLVEMDLPPNASAERVRAELEYVQRVVRPVSGVEHLLMLSTNPFRRWGRGACLIVQIAPGAKRTVGRAQIERHIRTALKQVPATACRLERLQGFPWCQEPIDFAVRGPDAGKVRLLTDSLGEHMRRSKDITAIFVDPATMPQPQLSMNVDGGKARALGVPLRDVFDTLQVYLGGIYVCDYDSASATCQVFISSGNTRADATTLEHIPLHSVRGLRVPLGTIAKIQRVMAPAAVDRLDGQPMAEITARPVRSSQLAETRGHCRRLFEDARKALHLPTTYELVWLDEMP